MQLQQQVIRSINIFYWITNPWDIQWIGFKVKTIELEPMKSRKYLYHTLMTKCTSKILGMMD